MNLLQRFLSRFTVPTPNTPTRVHRRLLLAGVAVAVAGSVITGTAFADGTSPDAGLLGVFNQTDSHGITIIQYQMSLDEGGLTFPATAALAFFAVSLWSLYTFFIGFVAWLVDWIVSMQWLDWIINPLTTLQTTLRQQLLNPLGFSTIGSTGAIGFLLLLAAGVGGWHLIRGRHGRGLGEWVMSAAAAAIAVGVLASPVTLFLGDGDGPAIPLEKARDLGVGLARMADGQPATGRDGPQFGSILVDAFIRPAHQIINYGTYIDVDDTKCVTTYDKTLKAGPYTKPAQARDRIGGCDPQLRDRAEAVSYFRIVTLVVVFEQTALLVSAVILVFAVLTVVAVLMLGWSSLKILIHAPLAIAPGDSREPLLRDLVDIGVGYCYLVGNLLLLSIVLQLVKAVFASPGTVPILVRFVGVELMLWAGIIMLITNMVMARRTGRGLHSRLTEKLRWTKRDSAGDRARDWAAQPAYGPMPGNPYTTAGPSAAGRNPVSGGSGGFSPTSDTGRRPNTNPPRLAGRLASTGASALGGLANSPNGMIQSKGGRLAFGAATLGAAAATGGTALAAKGTITGFRGAAAAGRATGKAAAVTGRATGNTAVSTGKAARAAATTTSRTVNDAHNAHLGYRVGARHTAATGRPRLDAVLRRSAAGHNHLQDQARLAHQAIRPVTSQHRPTPSDDYATTAHRAQRTPGTTTPPFTPARPRPNAADQPHTRPPGPTTPAHTRPVRPAHPGPPRQTVPDNTADPDGDPS